MSAALQNAPTKESPVHVEQHPPRRCLIFGEHITVVVTERVRYAELSVKVSMSRIKSGTFTDPTQP